ncbi:MAG: HIT domain-containing protein [Deinococcales bacterium]
MNDSQDQSETPFGRIVKGELPADIVYRDERVTAFRDIRPQAPVHVLIVPNRRIPTAADVTDADEAVLGHMIVVAAKIAEAEGLDKGYRLLVNCKEHGHQEVYHLHIHLLGGRPLGPMLCRPGSAGGGGGAV